MKPIYKILLLNVAISVVVVIAFFLTAFLLGYGSNSSYAKATMRLYIVFAAVHFAINVWLLQRGKMLNVANLSATFIELLIVYGLIAWYYTS